jgi:IS1 family transposase
MFNEVLFYARNPTHPILVTTDGFQFYEKAVRRVLDVLCVHGQVIKTRRNNRVIRVDRQLKIGTKARLAELLLESEDSETLNTSFVERLNLTIRQGSAYLQRRSPCHARYDRTLKEHMDLLMCYFNFLRPHRGLKFGKEIRTPAMEAGLTKCRLSFRVVFLGKNFCVLFAMVINLPQATIQSTHKQIFNPKISLRYHKAA